MVGYFMVLIICVGFLVISAIENKLEFKGNYTKTKMFESIISIMLVLVFGIVIFHFRNEILTILKK